METNRMMDYGALRLLHRHGDDWGEMREREHGAAEHDVERRLLRGGKIFRCEGCDEEITVVGPGEHE